MHQNFKEMIPNLPEDMLSISDIPSFYDASFLGHIHWKKEFRNKISNNTIFSLIKEIKLSYSNDKIIELKEVANNYLADQEVVEREEIPSAKSTSELASMTDVSTNLINEDTLINYTKISKFLIPIAETQLLYKKL